MPIERTQRQIERLLVEDEQALAQRDLSCPYARSGPGRDVASVLFKTERLDNVSRGRSKHRTQAIGRIGALSAPPGEQEPAHAYSDQTLEAAGKGRSQPQAGLPRLGPAKALLDAAAAAQRFVALQDLDFAVDEAREMKVQPALERALRHNPVLKA